MTTRDLYSDRHAAKRAKRRFVARMDLADDHPQAMPSHYPSDRKHVARSEMHDVIDTRTNTIAWRAGEHTDGEASRAVADVLNAAPTTCPHCRGAL